MSELLGLNQGKCDSFSDCFVPFLLLVEEDVFLSKLFLDSGQVRLVREAFAVRSNGLCRSFVVDAVPTDHTIVAT